MAGRRAWMLRAGLAMVLTAVAGCAGLPGRTEPVSVNVSDLRMGTAGVLEQQYFVTLRIQNPNDHDLDVDGVVFELEINDKAFARGTSGQQVKVPRFGSAQVEVETVSTLTGILRQLGGLAGESAEPSALRYRIRGRLHRSGFGTAVPFDDRGELALGQSTGKGEGR